MESVNIIIDSIYHKVQNQYTVAQRYQLIYGLKELAAGEDDLSYLSAEYKDILDQADSIRKSFTEQPKMLSYLWTVLTDLYGDMKKI